MSMMNHNRQSGPQHYNHGNPWAPQQHMRASFNINRFMHPPHAVQRPNYTPDNIFAPNVPTKAPPENFPFSNNHQGCHQNNGARFHGPQNHHNGPPYQLYPGRGRGRMRGQRGGGHGFCGGQRGGFSGQQSNNQSQKKKEKVDKRDLPENNVYFCDICDRGFKTEDKYKEHVDGHTKCSYDDCPYIAAPKLVQLHMSLQHRTGLAKKVWNMESEEDIKKWREDRKRNFPTAENIARKKKERAERIARGELLETKDFSKMRNARGRGRGRGRERGGRNDRGRGRNRWRDHDRVSEGKGKVKSEAGDSDDDAPPEEVKIKRCKAPEKVEASVPTPPLETSKIEIKSEPLTPKSSPEKSAGGGLALLASYGDSSSDESDEEQKVQSNVTGLKKSDSPPPSDVPAPSSQLPTKKRNALPNPFAPVSTPPSSPATSASPHQAPMHMPHVGVSPCVHKSPHMDSSCTSQSEDSPNTVSEVDISVNGIGKKEDYLNNNDKPVCSSDNLEDFHSQRDTNSPNTDIPNKSSKIHSPRTPEKASTSEKKNQRSPHAGGKREHSRDTGGGPPPKKIKRPAMPVLKKYTLLEKLLAPDIRRERNKILQCVHYIVKNKFFESHSPDNKDTDPAISADAIAVFSPQVKRECNV